MLLGSLHVRLSLFNTLGCSWSSVRDGSDAYREKGPGTGGTFRFRPKQPLPPPGELGAEGTQVPGLIVALREPGRGCHLSGWPCPYKA